MEIIDGKKLAKEIREKLKLKSNELKEKGLIDGIGMQSHLDVGFPSASAYKKALKAFVDTGLDIQVTELDITTTDLTESGFEKQNPLFCDACGIYALGQVFQGISRGYAF